MRLELQRYSVLKLVSLLFGNSVVHRLENDEIEAETDVKSR